MAADSSSSDEGVAVSSLLYILGLGSGGGLPEIAQRGHSWPDNLKETPKKWPPRHWLNGIWDYSGPYE